MPPELEQLISYFNSPRGHATIASIATIIVGLLTFYLVIRVVEDLLSKEGETFYPTSTHSKVLSFKLAKGTLTKGSGWKKQVQKEGFKLCDRVLSASLPLQPRPDHVAEMIKVCELPDRPSSLPIVYPAVLMVYPNCLLFAKAEYPFPAIGSVHVSNVTKVFRPLTVNEEYPAMIKVDPIVRPAKKGSEVTFISILNDKAGQPVWKNESTFLILHKRKALITPTPKPGGEEPEKTPPSYEKQFVLPKDMGCRYAAVAKDNNPIHTSNLAAKAFGFPGVIMHGMYLFLRAASECQAFVGDSITYPVEVTAKFIRPIVLPHKVELKVYEKKAEESPVKAKRSLKYQLLNKANKVAVEGFFYCTPQQSK